MFSCTVTPVSHQFEDLITAVDAAGVLGVHKNHVTKLARKGELPTAFKGPGLRGARFFHRDEVAKLAAERNLS